MPNASECSLRANLTRGGQPGSYRDHPATRRGESRAWRKKRRPDLECPAAGDVPPDLCSASGPFGDVMFGRNAGTIHAWRCAAALARCVVAFFTIDKLSGQQV